MTIDPQQRYIRLVGAGPGGQFFAVRADGTLEWWCHTGWQSGTTSWANSGGPRVIGSGWHGFAEVLGSTDGTLWAVLAGGRVLRYRYLVTDPATGAGTWENGGAGTQIGAGFDRFERWFGGPGGTLWCVDAAGDLYRSDYTGGALSAPVKVGAGFGDCTWLGADSGGVVYGLRWGVLTWWRHTGTGWVNGGAGISLGGGAWTDRAITYLAALGGGLLYAVNPSTSLTASASGDLLWSRLSNYQSVDASGTAIWAGVSKVVGGGFTCEPAAALQGYAQPFSAAPGGSVAVCASTTFTDLTASVWRHDLPGGAVQVLAPQAVTGRLQTLPTGYATNGCGWSSLLDVPVDPAWPSGLYSARLDGPAFPVHVPFVVRPAAPVAPVMVLLPSLTYEAYNTWSGHSAYQNCPTTSQVVLTSRRPSRTTNVEATGALDGGMYLDLLLLRWLAGEQYAYDVYTDQDLHADLGLLSRYRAVILGAHPEYVTSAMRQALYLYSRAGGRIVYLGGNGLYEPCDITAVGDRVVWRVPNGGRPVFRDRLLPETQVLGVGYSDPGWSTSAAYQVVNDHPVLAGTGLLVGDVFGTTGYMGHGASGWETDKTLGLDGCAAASQVIARGQNPSGGGAEMVWVDRPGGGWLFGVGSLLFCGALGDAAITGLLRNVMAAATAAP